MSEGAVKSPQNGAIGRNKNEVGVVGRLKFGGSFEFFFLLVDDQEMVLIRFGNSGFDAVDCHTAGKSGHTLKDRDGVSRDEVFRNVFCPVAGLLTGSFAETDNEQRRISLGVRRHGEVPAREGFAFQCGKLRGLYWRGYCKNERHGC